jgi:hypothetical protein
VIDLVEAAGVDVGPWAESSKGPVQIPARNSAFCGEWAFIERGRVIVLNEWHGEIREENGKIWRDPNPRAWQEKGRHSTMECRPNHIPTGVRKIGI